MKKILSIISLALSVGVSSQTNQTTPPPGASTTENYVYSRTYLEAATTSSATAKQVQAIQYFDGLGRPKQSIAIKASPKGNDMVTPIVYDGFGREADSYLPVSMSTATGGIQSLAPADVVTYYTSPKNTTTKDFDLTDANPFSHKALESSPLDRVLSQTQVGNAWSNKPVNFTYEANADNEVKKYIATFNYTTFGATLSIAPATDTNANNGSYKGGQLYKNTVTDEDGNVSIEFKNGKGQTLLVRKMLNGSPVDTYYVYNEYDQLAFVVPPLASASFKNLASGTVIGTTNADDLSNLCYQYKYDGRNRLVEKKLPGKGWEYMVYDRQDRLVATQDANLRASGQWLFTKYDQFGRVIYTGITTGGTRTTEQANAEAKGANSEARTSTVGFSSSGLAVYYTNAGAYPSAIDALLSVSYYDAYPAGVPTMPSSVLGQSLLTGASATITQNGLSSERSTKGLPTASFTKNIEDNGWTKSYTFYDTKGRAVSTYSQNYLGGYTRTETLLDFAGVPQATNTYHRRSAADTPVTINERFTYNAQNMLLKHYHKVDANPEVLLTENHYNELGQLDNKKVGDNIQSIDYAYNIRGWMRGINLDAAGNVQAGRLFSYKINYQEPLEIASTKPYAADQSLEVKPKYNGNISEVTWFSGTDASAPAKKYGYVYDGLNRLLAGFYFKKAGNGYIFTEENNEIPQYDLNGNITRMARYAYLQGNVPNMIDNLDYAYEGNRLVNVTDNANNYSGFEGVGAGDIAYDDNGNMTAFPAKNINEISYNHLNLPKHVDIGNEPEITSLDYTYRADGTKIKKKNITTTYGIAETKTSTSVTDYLDGFEYLLKTSTTASADPVEELSAISTSKAMEQEAFTPVQRLIPIRPEAQQSYLQFFPTAEGFYDYQKNLYIYQYKDHLGNTRLSYAKNASGGIGIIDQNDYYPFGMSHLNTGTAMFGDGSYTNYKYNGKELQETGMYDYGARMYMPDIGRWGVVDPLAEKYPGWSPYAYAFNNPVKMIDPDGREPIPSQAGFILGFVKFLNNTRSKMGTLTGSQGHDAMMRLGKTEMNWAHFRPEPMTTNPFNKSKDKYIYTTKGGWLDMAHFMFYAGKAYDYKQQKESAQKAIAEMEKAGGFALQGISADLVKTANMSPVGEAVQDGYRQEMSDRFVAGHSAYSYEDLPSDKLGAEFGANYYDPNSKLSLGEQLLNYVNSLGATDPKNAPNYKNLPKDDSKLDSPTKTNHTTKPMYTK